MSKVLIGIDKSKSYRVYLTITTELVEKARKIHETTPLASAGLGRVLTGTGLMSIMLKNPQDKLTVMFKGDGPAMQILATGYADGRAKGYIANPYVELPLTKENKLDVGGSLGIGELTVIKDIGMKEPYVGKIALVSGEIADDLTAYYYISEQQNTSVALGVKVGKEQNVIAAGGMIIQMLPGAEEEAINELEKMLGEMKPITTLIEKAILCSAGKTEEGILIEMMEDIFGDMKEDYRSEVLAFKEIHWECDCSKERMEQALMTIGADGLRELIEEDGKAEVGCQFCETRYTFTKEELEKLLEKAGV